VFGLIDAHYDQAIQASQKAKSASSLHAIQYFEQYLNGIILQWNRIVTAVYQSTNPLVARSLARIRLSHQEELDFHFYLICWDKVLKYFGLVAKLEHDPAISKSFGKVSKLLHEAKEGRNFYEHLDMELRKGGIGTRGRGFGYHQGYHFSFVGVRSGQPVEKKVNLGMDEIRRIGEAYESIIATLKARK
jgi:hypothetical protein